MPISRTAAVVLAVITAATLPAVAATGHGKKTHHTRIHAKAPPVQPEVQPRSAAAAYSGTGQSGPILPGGLSFLGPARGGIGQ